MSAVITGATGFIAQNLLRSLAERGERVIAVSRTPDLRTQENLVSWRAHPQTEKGWNEILDGASIVYHCAWSSLPQSSNEDLITDASENILGTLRLLNAAKGRKDLRIVFPSSGGTVYGILNSVPVSEKHSTNPRCAYGVSKLTIEKYLALHRDLWGLDTVALRISNAYGAGQQVGRNFGAISTFAMRALRGDLISIFGDGSVVRDYIYIDDLVGAMIAAGRLHGGPSVINIGSGVGKSLDDILCLLGGILTKEIKVEYLAKREFDVPVSVLDISLAGAVLNWIPHTPFEVGVELTVQALCGKVPKADHSLTNHIRSPLARAATSIRIERSRE
jgi:UDP-glucose 4-epimerase